jgi:hypothetical protein
MEFTTFGIRTLKLEESREEQGSYSTPPNAEARKGLRYISTG